MKKMFMFISVIVIMATNLTAAIYYSLQPATPAFPNSGVSWNLNRDGSGANGFSTTYSAGVNDIILQTNRVMYSTSATGDLNWGANSYAMENGTVLVNQAGKYAYFTNGNITISGTNAYFKTASANGVGSSAGGVRGTAKVLLGSNTLSLEHYNSSSSGIFEFGLDVVGSGTIDFRFADVKTTWLLSNLSTNFTGLINANTLGGVVQFAAGDGAINADLRLANNNTRTSRLDLNGAFSIGTLLIENTIITNGVYTYGQLIDYGASVSKNFADNLIDNGGTIYVGQASIPEPATIGLLILSAVSILVVRRVKGL